MADKIVIGILRALLTADTAQFEAGMRQASTGLKQFAKDANMMGRQATQLGTSLTTLVTLPILGLGAAVAKVAIDFEQSFAGVRKTTEATEEQFAALSKGLRELSKQIPINVNELNHLAEIAGALGIPTDKVVEFTGVMAKLGKTTNVTAEEAANAIAKIQNIFAQSGQDTERFASALVLLGNKGASTEAQILELANRAASMGRAIGLSQADVLGFAAAIANVGIESEAGGSAISRTFNDIALAVATGTKDLQVFARVSGLSVDDFVAKFKTDARGAVLAFIGGLANIATSSEETTKKLNAIAASGGDVSAAIMSMVEADTDLAKVLKDAGIIEVRQLNLLRALALAFGTEQGLAKSIEFANRGFRENTELQRASSARFATTAAELTKLWSAIKDVGITIGNTLLPMIKESTALITALLPLLEKAGQLFAALPMPVQALAVGFGLMVAAIGPALFVFGQLALAANQLALAFAANGVATRALTGLLALRTGLAGAFTTLTTAIRASALAVGLFSAALAAIIIPAALIALQKMYEDFVKHQQDMADAQLKNRTAEQLLGRDLKDVNVALSQQSNLYGDAAKTAGEFANRLSSISAEADEVIRRQQLIDDEKIRLGFDPMQGGKIPFNSLVSAGNNVSVVVDKVTGQLRVLAVAGQKAGQAGAQGIQSLTQELRDAQAQLAKLEPAQLREIAAGVEMSKSNEQIVQSFNNLFPKIKLTEVAVGLYRDQLQKAATDSRKAARDFAELTGLQERKDAFDLAIALQQGILNLNEMTIDSQEEVAKILIKGVQSWIALGQAVPASVEKQLDAVFKLAVVPKVLEDIRAGTEGLKDDQRQILNQSSVSVSAMRKRAEDSADVQLRAINDTTSAQKDALATSREIEFQRAEHTIQMAEQAGVHWRDIYAMERALHRARVDVAIEEENRLFRESTALLDMTGQFQSKQYRAMADEHNLRVRQMEEQFLLSEQAKWDALRRTKDVWFVALKDMKATALRFFTDVSDNLLSILTGLGHDMDGSLRQAAEDAREHFEKVKKSGKSSAEAISNAFQRMREAEEAAQYTFVDRMRDVWLSFKSMVIQILNDLLGHFVRSFIGGMIRSIAGANLGARLGNVLTGAGPGGIGSAIPGVAGAVAPGLIGGGAVGGGALAATTINAAGIPTNMAVGSGLVAPSAAGGGAGAASFLTNPAFWTNPWTIGIAAGAALVTFGIKRGWLRGGEEALKVSPRRDQFLLQFGPPGTGMNSGFQKLAERLTQMTGLADGSPLFQALARADTVKDFEAAQADIVAVFRRQRMAIKSFAMGGFVPPGAIVPAVLHGGLYGEDVTPRTDSTATGRVVNIVHNIRIEGMLDREGAEAFYRDYVIPAEKRALQLNTDDILTVHRRVMVP